MTRPFADRLALARRAHRGPIAADLAWLAASAALLLALAGGFLG